MATRPSFLSSSYLPRLPSLHLSRPSLCISLRSTSANPRKFPTLVRASSAPSFDDLSSESRFRRTDSSKKSTLSKLIHEIEPLDVSLIQRDVPLPTVDAMKRTISGMLGLLPSDQFQVFIEALWEPLSKLLVSSMMTGYTLRNAEYRLCLEKNLGAFEENIDNKRRENFGLDVQGLLLESVNMIKLSAKGELSSKSEDTYENTDIQGLDNMSPEAQQYILHLHSQLSSVKKELHEVKRRSDALQMQQFVGEEKNDLLDYLRSLRPEKVAELSEPASSEVKETIYSVVHGLLATLSPKMHSKVPPLSENSAAGMASVESGDFAEIVENTSLQFQPHISLTRDYLARLLFWCMLLGHYLRGLEYRMELMELLSLTRDAENEEQVD